jgi:hypothetical protein
MAKRKRSGKPVKRKRSKAAHHEPVKRKRRKPIPPKPRKRQAPKGYTGLGKGTAKEIEKTIRGMVEAVVWAGYAYDTVFQTATNSDGSLDCEWRVRHIPRGVSVSEIMIDLVSNIHPIPYTYIRAVLRYTAPEGVDTGDRRYRGQSEAWSGFYRNTARNLPLLVLSVTGIKGMLANLMRRKRRKPTEIMIRWHWNPDGIQPNLFRKRYAKRYHKPRSNIP